MVYYRKILATLSLFTFPFFVQCGGGAEDDGQSAKNYAGQSEDEDAAFFAAPTEYGYSLQVIKEENDSYLVLKYEYDEITREELGKNYQALVNHSRKLDKAGIHALDIGDNKLRVKNWVGVIQIPRVTIEILPKIDIRSDEKDDEIET